jgi:hypothetical protein
MDQRASVVAVPAQTCTCPVPLPEIRAVWKGAARTYCSRCNLPVQLDFSLR